MSNTKWTPGPWRVEKGRSDWGMPRSHAVVPDDGSGFDFDGMIAEVHSLQPYCAGESKANIEKASTDIANAHLIAAAPDLYEALLEAHLAMINSIPSYAGSYICRRNQAVLAKARGES